MILRNTSYEAFAREVKETGKKIIVYGAGMIGQISAPYVIHRYGLDEEVLCYADQSEEKRGMTIALNGRETKVWAPDKAFEAFSNFVLLITNSNSYAVISALDRREDLENVNAWVLPVMQLTHRKQEEGDRVVHVSETSLIPKKIHYCWFSGREIPGELRQYMESWKKFCPDYEIIRWDEGNYDISWNPYMRQAYEAEKWGFVPDIARLDILCRHGGIYLDTDVELVRSLDELLFQPAFCGTEKWGNVNCGGCFGAAPGSQALKRMLDFRVDEPFRREDGAWNLTTCGYYETTPLIERGLRLDDTTQSLDGITVYSSDFFHPMEYMSGELKLTENTFSIHHFHGGWLDEKGRAERRRTRELYAATLRRMEEADCGGR